MLASLRVRVLGIAYQSSVRRQSTVDSIAGERTAEVKNKNQHMNVFSSTTPFPKVLWEGAQVGCGLRHCRAARKEGANAA